MSLLKPFFFSLSILVPTLFHSLGMTQTDPVTHWKTLKTPHFHIIFDSTQQELAERYARYAEVAYRDLAPIFKELPETTTIWVKNTTDISNGFAIGFPYPYSVVFPVIPTSGQSIGEYGNWGQELVTHEYTHILQFEPKHGVMGLLRKIFGSVVVPNGLLPRWWLEGLAVETESQLSNGGRLRSLRQQALLRALTLGDGLYPETIDRINDTSIPDWLGGSRPYLFGSLIWKELVDRYGADSIYTLNQAYSRRVPFFGVNSPVKKLSGKKYSEILESVYQSIEKKARDQISSIENAGGKKGREFYKKHTTSFQPLVSPDGRHLAYVETHIDEGKRLVIKSKKGAENSFESVPATIHSAVVPSNRISWSPDSQKIYFDKIDLFQRYYSFSDIYSYELESKKVKQITHGLRAREPSASLNGNSLFFVKLLGDQLQIAQMNVDGKNVKVWHSPAPGMRVSHPEPLDSENIVFTQRDQAGQEVLKKLNLQTGTVETFLEHLSPVYRPRKTKKGLMIISGKTGVYNAYLTSGNLDSASPVTNSKTAIEYVDWDSKSKELVFSELSPKGSVVALSEGFEKARPPQIGPTVPYERSPYKARDVSLKKEIDDYSPWSYLLPRYWMPYIVLSEDDLFVQASTSGADPLGKHSYSLLGAYDTGTEQFNWGASYTNQVTHIPLNVTAYDYYDFFGASTLLRRENYASLTGAGYFWGLDESWNWSLGWNYVNTEVSGRSTRRQGPRATVRYKNISQRGHQVAPENGGDALLSLTQYIDSLGDLGFFNTSLNASYYFAPRFFRKHHVLSAKIRGVYSPDNNELFIGASTSGGTFQNTLISNQLLMRGYFSGNFIAQNAVNASIEYIFPLKESYSGWGLFPVFSRNWHGRIIADFISLDGVFFNEKANVFSRANFGKVYAGTGAELHWSTTIAYHVPFRIFLGIYYGVNEEASGGAQSFIGFAL